MTDAIAVDSVSKRYGRTLALDAVSFAVRQGDLFALLGPNGAGKTTLMHILCAILAPDSGSVALGGRTIAAFGRRGRGDIGVVFQEPSLDDRLTVHENLDFHGLVYGVPGRLRRQRIAEMLAVVELTDWRDRLVRSLSTGMKRRLEIARALIHDSRILFLDEPTVGLDAQTRERIWGYVRELQAQRDLTIVITTHYIEEVETADQVCVIDHGTILALDRPAALKAAYGQQLVRVLPRDAAAAAALTAEHEARIVKTGAEITLKSDGDAFVEALLARHGARIRRFSVEDPSLESVFLSLTGRDLRDQEAGPRARTLAFGRQGGEHTR